jgi:hypothetical protein
LVAIVYSHERRELAALEVRGARHARSMRLLEGVLGVCTEPSIR